jgi:Uncharacterized conserved protein
MTIRYKLDAKNSRFTVQGFAGGMLSSFAHNPIIAIRDFTGEAQLSSDGFEPVSLRLSIKADSLEVTDDVSKKDRQEIESKMRQEVLETARYPEIVFESKDISTNRIGENWYRVVISGDLSLHGVTRNEKIDAQVKLQGDILRASSEFKLRQSDYKIKQVSAAMGSIKLKDELKFSFDIVAQKE